MILTAIAALLPLNLMQSASPTLNDALVSVLLLIHVSAVVSISQLPLIGTPFLHAITAALEPEMRNPKNLEAVHGNVACHAGAT